MQLQHRLLFRSDRRARDLLALSGDPDNLLALIGQDNIAEKAFLNADRRHAALD